MECYNCFVLPFHCHVMSRRHVMHDPDTFKVHGRNRDKLLVYLLYISTQKNSYNVTNEWRHIRDIYRVLYAVLVNIL